MCYVALRMAKPKRQMDDQVVIRIQSRLLAKLEKEAELLRRSTSHHIRIILEDHYKSVR